MLWWILWNCTSKLYFLIVFFKSISQLYGAVNLMRPAACQISRDAVSPVCYDGPLLLCYAMLMLLLCCAVKRCRSSPLPCNIVSSLCPNGPLHREVLKSIEKYRAILSRLRSMARFIECVLCCEDIVKYRAILFRPCAMGMACFTEKYFRWSAV